MREIVAYQKGIPNFGETPLFYKNKRRQKIMEKKIEVVNNNGQLVVSSRQVAEDFGKRHDHVMVSIGGLLKNQETP